MLEAGAYEIGILVDDHYGWGRVKEVARATYGAMEAARLGLWVNPEAEGTPASD